MPWRRKQPWKHFPHMMFEVQVRLGSLARMKTPGNVGMLWRTTYQQPWRCSQDERPLGQREFEQQQAEFSAYLDGVLFGLRTPEGQVYLEGNNYGDRTHAVWAYDTIIDAKSLVPALANWLGAPRRQGWRIILPGRKSQQTILIFYRDCIPFSPKFRTLEEAVAAYSSADPSASRIFVSCARFSDQSRSRD